eukprot:gene12870-15115_t
MPFQAMIKDMEGKRKRIVNDGVRLRSEMKEMNDAHRKAQQKYEKVAKELETTKLEIKDARDSPDTSADALAKLDKKRERLEGDVASADDDYREQIKATNDFQHLYNVEKMPKILSDFEHFILTHAHLTRTYWTNWSNIVNDLPPVFASTYEGVKKIVEQVDNASDLQEFIKRHQMKKILTESFKYEPYVEGKLGSKKSGWNTKTLRSVFSKKGDESGSPTSTSASSLPMGVRVAEPILPTASFGVKLETLMERQKESHPQLEVPRVLVVLTTAITRLKGHVYEGIFRVPGIVTSIKEMRQAIDKGDFSLTGVDDVRTPAALLKLWLRDIPDPLVPVSLYKAAIDSPLDSLSIVQKLSPLSQRVLNYLIHFIQIFIRYEFVAHSKMGTNNMAMIFAPTILRNPSDDPSVLLGNVNHEKAFVENLISSTPHAADPFLGLPVSASDALLDEEDIEELLADDENSQITLVVEVVAHLHLLQLDHVVHLLNLDGFELNLQHQHLLLHNKSFELKNAPDDATRAEIFERALELDTSEPNQHGSDANLDKHIKQNDKDNSLDFTVGYLPATAWPVTQHDKEDEEDEMVPTIGFHASMPSIRSVLSSISPGLSEAMVYNSMSQSLPTELVPPVAHNFTLFRPIDQPIDFDPPTASDLAGFFHKFTLTTPIEYIKSNFSWDSISSGLLDALSPMNIICSGLCGFVIRAVVDFLAEILPPSWLEFVNSKVFRWTVMGAGVIFAIGTLGLVSLAGSQVGSNFGKWIQETFNTRAKLMGLVEHFRSTGDKSKEAEIRNLQSSQRVDWLKRLGNIPRNHCCHSNGFLSVGLCIGCNLRPASSVGVILVPIWPELNQIGAVYIHSRSHFQMDNTRVPTRGVSILAYANTQSVKNPLYADRRLAPIPTSVPTRLTTTNVHDHGTNNKSGYINLKACQLCRTDMATLMMIQSDEEFKTEPIKYCYRCYISCHNSCKTNLKLTHIVNLAQVAMTPPASDNFKCKQCLYLVSPIYASTKKRLKMEKPAPNKASLTDSCRVPIKIGSISGLNRMTLK